MKNIYIILAVIILSSSSFAQAPEKMSYQAVVRDSDDHLVVSQVVSMQISILQTTETGTAVYTETHTPSTNINGLVTLEIGTGTTTDDFTTIDWSAGPYFIKTETDLTGGTNYSITGTSQILSVPYALHAKTAESLTSTCGHAIGDTYRGGIIFYLDPTGCHGLICTPTDLSSGALWDDENRIIGTDGIGIYDGKYNTYTIDYTQVGTGSAGLICSNLFLAGYEDWYLPSITELNLMYLNIGQGNSLGLGNVGGFANSFYWSSTEHDSTRAWSQNFESGTTDYGSKLSSSNYVRAVRAF